MDYSQFSALAQMHADSLAGTPARHRKGLQAAVIAYKRLKGCQYPTPCPDVLWRQDALLLDLDHIDPDTKTAAVGSIVNKTTKKTFAASIRAAWLEAQKCRVLCASHHRIVTLRE